MRKPWYTEVDNLPVMSEIGTHQRFDKIEKRLDAIEELIISGNIRLEALVSTAIEREMITQDSFDKLIQLLIEFGKKKGWVKKD